MPGRRRPSSAAVGLGLLAALLLSSCASAVDVVPGERATDVACAALMVRLPDELGDRARRPTTSQSTSAWGSPAVVLRCGLAPPPPSTDPCLTVAGVDWLAQTLPGGRRYTTYGRDPAVDVLLPRQDDDGADTVLAALAGPVAAIPQTRACL